MEEFRADNVQYMEIRSTLPEEECLLINIKLYGEFVKMRRAVLSIQVCSEMWPSCNPASREEVLLMFKEESEQFVREHGEDMCGVKLIFAPLR